MRLKSCSIHGIYSGDEKRCPKCIQESANTYNQTKRDKSSTKIYDSKRWREHTRPKALLRDNYTCVRCNTLETSENLIADHIIELSDGGEPYKLSNIQTLCRQCHNRKTKEEIKKRNEGNRHEIDKDTSNHGIRFI